MQCGDLVMLQVLHRLGFRWQPPAQYFLSAMRGYADICLVPRLAWLLEAGCPVDWPEVLAEADGNRVLSPVVKAWLQERSQSATFVGERIPGAGRVEGLLLMHWLCLQPSST